MPCETELPIYLLRGARRPVLEFLRTTRRYPWGEPAVVEWPASSCTGIPPPHVGAGTAWPVRSASP